MKYMVFLIAFVLIKVINGQNSSKPTLLEILTPTIVPPNEVANLLFPPSIISVETPIAIRYVLLALLPTYTINAACHSTALSFLGTKDPIPSFFCTPLPRAKLTAYIQNRLFRSQFPIEGKSFEEFLLRNGLDVTNTSTDPSTIVGWANTASDRLVQFFENDGWNSLGDVTRRDFRQQYSNSIKYRPQNHAGLPESRLRRPLRWQPLTQEADAHGRFISQVHVVPHIGFTVKPLVLSDEEFQSRVAPSPYDMPNKKKTLSKRDDKAMRKLIKELFARNQKLTKEQVALAAWWDNKFFSLGGFIFYYQTSLKLFDDETSIRYGMGEVLAQHDAVLIAWKEKIKHDLVRPTTIIRKLLAGKHIRAFKSFAEGTGLINAEEWEPIVKVQPHSEYPSASSVICKASLDHLEAALKEEIVGKNGTIPPFDLELNQFTFPTFPLAEPITVKFDTLTQAARSCGNSRLFAGVHFSPSVPAGFKLAKGLGRKAYVHMADLWAGRVPATCSRCSQD